LKINEPWFDDAFGSDEFICYNFLIRDVVVILNFDPGEYNLDSIRRSMDWRKGKLTPAYHLNSIARTVFDPDGIVFSGELSWKALCSLVNPSPMESLQVLRQWQWTPFPIVLWKGFWKIAENIFDSKPSTTLPD